MAAARLTDAQKAQLVERYQQGESSATLSRQFGCSANTVIRVAKAALSPEDYERLKGSRAKGGRSRAAPTDGAASGLGSSAAADRPPARTSLFPLQAQQPDQDGDVAVDDDSAAVLPLDDADDFCDDSDDDLGVDEDDPIVPLTPIVPLVISQDLDKCTPRAAQPLSQARLPAALYMLVDKSVELQPKPLASFSELGVLADDERHFQAILLFINQRQAKRQCGRSQRVIKLPDSTVLFRTAPYLIAKGISRVVVEGAVYVLPDC